MQTAMAGAADLAPSLRVITCIPEQQAAGASGSNRLARPISPQSTPDVIITPTPARRTTMAVSRCRPTGSRSTGMARSVINSSG